MEITLVTTPKKQVLYINGYKEMEDISLSIGEVINYLIAYSVMEGENLGSFAEYYVEDYSFPDKFDFQELIDKDYGDLEEEE